MESPADAYSPLNGTELIIAKVAELAVQAYAIGSSYNLYSKDPTYAEIIIDSWPADVPLTYIGSNIGGNTYFGARLTTELNLTYNPVAYAFNHSAGYNKTHKTWDATALYYAVRGLDDVYAFNFTEGHDMADASATTSWNYTGYNASENGVIFAANGIGNVSFAERLEDILLWQPGDAIPSKLAKIAVCTTATASSSTTMSSSTAEVSTMSTGLSVSSNASYSVPYTLSTVYKTVTSTISSCAPTVTDCPYRTALVITTAIIIDYTTYCPVSATSSTPMVTSGAETVSESTPVSINSAETTSVSWTPVLATPSTTASLSTSVSGNSTGTISVSWAPTLATSSTSPSAVFTGAAGHIVGDMKFAFAGLLGAALWGLVM